MTIHKCTKKEKYMRERYVEDLLIKGYREHEVLQKCAKEWGITRRQVQNYMYKVIREWQEAKLENAPALKFKYMQRLEIVIREALEAREYGSVIKAQDMLNKMIGAYNETTAQNDGPAVITISENAQPVHQLTGNSDVIDVEKQTPDDESSKR